MTRKPAHNTNFTLLARVIKTSMRHLIGLLFLFFISCQNRQEHKEDVVQDTIIIKKPDPTPLQIHKADFYFDTLTFKKSFDSLLSKITETELKSSLEIDTLKGTGNSYFYTFIDSSLYTIKYRFRPTKPNEMLSITVYESFFKDSIQTDRQFKITKIAGGRNALKRKSPAGLSYAFDYLIKYKDKIILLNAPCPYADKSYRKLLPLFKQTFKIKLPADTISCKCGWFCE